MDKFEEFKEFAKNCNECSDFKVEKAINCFEEKEKEKEKIGYIDQTYNHLISLCKQYNTVNITSEPILKYPGYSPFPCIQEIIGERVVIEFRDKE